MSNFDSEFRGRLALTCVIGSRFYGPGACASYPDVRRARGYRQVLCGYGRGKACWTSSYKGCFIDFCFCIHRYEARAGRDNCLFVLCR